jgi:acetyl-CoA acetyltransferase
MCAANFPKHLEGEARFVTDRRSSPPVNGTVSPRIASRYGVSERALKLHGLEPMARIHDFTVTAGDPVIMLEEPLRATRRSLEKAGLSIDDIDLYEVNEAFAPVPLAWLRELEADPAKLKCQRRSHRLGTSARRVGNQASSYLDACASSAW